MRQRLGYLNLIQLALVILLLQLSAAAVVRHKANDRTTM